MQIYHHSISLLLINSAFFNGIWPFDETIVQFLKKSGKTEFSNPSSWRPISITSHLGKIVERVIDRRLRSSDILDIDEQQFGFQLGKSTLHCLFKLYHDILAVKNSPIATVYDLEKAFDSVDQTLLLSKLINSGLFGPMLATIKSFYRIGKSVFKSMIISKCHLSLLMVFLRGLYCHLFLFIFYTKGFLQAI